MGGVEMGFSLQQGSNNFNSENEMLADRPVW